VQGEAGAKLETWEGESIELLAYCALTYLMLGQRRRGVLDLQEAVATCSGFTVRGMERRRAVKPESSLRQLECIRLNVTSFHRPRLGPKKGAPLQMSFKLPPICPTTVPTLSASSTVTDAGDFPDLSDLWSPLSEQ